jgi:hypothetical protein
MLSHVSLGTNDAGRAAAFYDPVLAVLGLGKTRFQAFPRAAFRP